MRLLRPHKQRVRNLVPTPPAPPPTRPCCLVVMSLAPADRARCHRTSWLTHSRARHSPLYRSAIDGTCPEICMQEPGTGQPASGCSSHDQCSDGYYCDIFDDCYDCSYCITVHNDAYDGVCPDTCAPFSTHEPPEPTTAEPTAAPTTSEPTTAQPTASTAVPEVTDPPYCVLLVCDALNAIQCPNRCTPTDRPTSATTTQEVLSTSAAAVAEECPRNCGTVDLGGGSCRPNGRCLACNENRLRVNGACVQSLSCKGRQIQTGSLSGQGCQCLQEHCHFCTRVVQGDTCRVSSTDARMIMTRIPESQSPRAFSFSASTLRHPHTMSLPPPGRPVGLTHIRHLPQRSTFCAGLSRWLVPFELGVC